MPETPPHRWRYPWLEVAVADGWIAAYRVEQEKGQMIVTELRVFPGRLTEARPHGERAQKRTPRGGITAAIAREAARVRPARELAHSYSRELQEQIKHRLRKAPSEVLAALPRMLDAEPRRPGRRGRSDRFYAWLGLGYWIGFKGGSSRPVADLAARLDYSPAYIRDLLHEARERGLLTRPPSGQPGGELTPKGWRLVAPMIEQVPPPRLDKETRGKGKKGSE